jgi:hypothetical protein
MTEDRAGACASAGAAADDPPDVPPDPDDPDEPDPDDPAPEEPGSVAGVLGDGVPGRVVGGALASFVPTADVMPNATPKPTSSPVTSRMAASARPDGSLRLGESGAAPAPGSGGIGGGPAVAVCRLGKLSADHVWPFQ